jgi:ATP-dependent Clp protease protease subunit
MQPIQTTTIDTIYINYFDVIDMPRINTMMAFCANVIAQQKPKKLYFLFSSPGGNVNAGITFYNFLKALPCEIIMHNNGSIDSIANIVFMAGKQRFASPNSSFLFHGVALRLPQVELNLTKIKEFTSGIEKDQEKIAGIIAENTKMGKKEIKKLFSQGEVKDVQFALKRGIINEIKPSKIPEGEPFVNISIQFNNNIA